MPTASSAVGGILISCFLKSSAFRSSFIFPPACAASLSGMRNRSPLRQTLRRASTICWDTGRPLIASYSGGLSSPDCAGSIAIPPLSLLDCLELRARVRDTWRQRPVPFHRRRCALQELRLQPRRRSGGNAKPRDEPRAARERGLDSSGSGTDRRFLRLAHVIARAVTRITRAAHNFKNLNCNFSGWPAYFCVACLGTALARMNGKSRSRGSRCESGVTAQRSWLAERDNGCRKTSDLRPRRIRPLESAPNRNYLRRLTTVTDRRSGTPDSFLVPGGVRLK